MEETIKSCINLFLKTKDSKIYIDKVLIDEFMAKNKKEQNRLIKRFLLKETCSLTNLDIEEIIIWKKINEYFELFIKEFEGLDIDDFVCKNICFSLAKGLIELYIKELFFDNKNPLPLTLETKEVPTTMEFDNTDYLMTLGMVQDTFCKKEKNFLRIADKLMDDDLVRNIQHFDDINILALTITFEKMECFKNNKILKIFAHCLAIDIIRSSILHFGLLKESMEDFGF